MLLGLAQAGDDAAQQASLHSSMDLPHDVTLDGDFRYVAALPSPHVPAYGELSLRLGWRPASHWELSVTGSNLLHAHHEEYPGGDAIGRAVLGGARYRW
jgi:iron complex outermembrane receptor protein